ncbi:MAG: hypothetical protein H6945_07650 [Zoogloeaceae bacterium]|nr:hypothetical protein [Rhodocyclaceae bacterium]MCP5235597.1 hypothetical protein [Zoogloeaceae bacterium]
MGEFSCNGRWTSVAAGSSGRMHQSDAAVQHTGADRPVAALALARLTGAWRASFQQSIEFRGNRAAPVRYGTGFAWQFGKALNVCHRLIDIKDVS